MAVKDLKWVLTEYGKRRITQMLSNPVDRIHISCIHIGKSNESDFRTRESLNGGAGELLEPISYADKDGIYTKNIPVYEKGVSDELENTVYFKSLIDENMSGFEIREVGLFEEIGNQLFMFAVGIGEPINKPALEKGYIIAIDYTLFIESANLLEVYDRIELDADNEFVKQIDVESIYQSVLFVEANLAEQIGKNTHILGLGRAQQLNDLIDKNILTYNSASISNYYANLANSVTDLKNILGCWSFGYTDVYGTTQVIKDFSSHGLNISTNNPLTTYAQEYIGVLSTLNFTNDDHFIINRVDPVVASTNIIELGELINHEFKGTLIFSNLPYDGAGGWYINGIVHTIEDVKTNYINYYTPATTATPNASCEEHIILSDTLKSSARGPHTWACSVIGDTPRWTNELGVVYFEYEFKDNVINYITDESHTGPRDGDIIEIGGATNPQNNDSITFTGEQFDLIRYRWDEEYIEGNPVQVQHCYDSDFTFMAMLQHNTKGEDNILLAQSNDAYSTHNFEIRKTKNNAIELVLYSDSDTWIKYSTPDYSVPNAIYNVIITYTTAGLSPTASIYINGFKYAITKSGTQNEQEEYTYYGMQPNALATTSYILRTNAETGALEHAEGINAKIGFMCLIKECIPAEKVRCNALFLNSLCGKNVYFRI